MQKSLRTYDSVGRDVLGYLPPKLVIGQRWQIVYYCFDPDVGKLVRKRVAVPFIKSKLERKAYANCMIIALNDKLSKGWNPCIALTNPKSYTLFDEVCQEYKRYLFKMEGTACSGRRAPVRWWPASRQSPGYHGLYRRQADNGTAC